MKFTDRSVAALKPQETTYEAWETGRSGFGVRVRPSGKKSFIYLYRFEGKARRMTLGAYPALSIATAHRQHAQAQEQLAKGIDPGAVKAGAKHADMRAPTVATLIDEYMTRWAKPRKRSWREDERLLNRDVLPVWGQRKAKSITRRDVLTLLDAIIDRGAPVMANRVQAVISRMFRFAVERDVIESSPCIGIRKQQETQKSRYLTDAELVTFWRGLDNSTMPDSHKLALRLILVTAQRPGECAGITASERDDTAQVWEIPPERTKNKRPHIVPLSDLARSILDEAAKLSSGTDWIFPMPNRKGPIDSDTLSRSFRRHRAELGIPDKFTPHDLRRTAATHLGALGISPYFVARVLNHTDTSVTAIYNRHDYLPEKREALNAWAVKLANLLNGNTGKVLPMVRDRG